MCHPLRFGVSASRQPRGFTFIEVLLVLGIIGLMIVCVVGFFISRHQEPLHPKPVPASTSPAPKTTPAAPVTPAP